MGGQEAGQFMPMYQSKEKNYLAEIFPATNDYILVVKHFGSFFTNDFIGYLMIKDHATEILAEAKRREETK